MDFIYTAICNELYTNPPLFPSKASKTFKMNTGSDPICPPA